MLGVEMASLGPPGALCAVCCEKDFQAEGCTLPWSGYQAEGVLRELLPVIAHSQGDVEMRSSSLTPSWSSGGNGRSTEGQERGDNTGFEQRGNSDNRI